MYFSSIQVKLFEQLSLNLWIRKINSMVTYWRSAGIYAPIDGRRDNAPGA